jgi:hypothetical protein
MRWLSLVRLPLRRVCPRVAVHPVCLQAALRAWGRVGLHAAADSTAHRCPGAGSAAGALFQGRKLLRAPRIFPGQDLAGQEAWLRTASLRAAAPNRRPLHAPRIFPRQDLAGQEAWLRTASLKAAGIVNRNSHRQFNPFLKGADRFYRQLLKVSSPDQERSSLDQDRRARDFLIFQGKAPVY